MLSVRSRNFYQNQAEASKLVRHADPLALRLELHATVRFCSV